MKLPGAGGAPEIASGCHEVFVVLPQSPRAFVARLDFVTSFGHGDGGDHRARLGAATKGPTKVITDLCILEPDPDTKELAVTSLHPGVSADQVRAATGWPVHFAAQVAETAPPTADDLAILRDLHRRTAEAHGAVEVA